MQNLEISFLNSNINYVIPKNVEKKYGFISSDFGKKYRLKYHDDLFYVYENKNSIGGFKTIQEARKYLDELIEKEKTRK
ncbi:MAG TPA: hypothetical protein VN026_09945, partial [Bacteroidia bacterium]|nr:hypothetical protein [Bacteroidia bacterium]